MCKNLIRMTRRHVAMDIKQSSMLKDSEKSIKGHADEVTI